MIYTVYRKKELDRGYIMGESNKKSEMEILALKYMEEGRRLVVENRTDDAIKKIKIAIGFLKEDGNDEKRVIYLNVIGIIYVKNKEFEKAFDYFLEAMAIAEVLDCEYLKAICYTNVGTCYLRKGRQAKAYDYFNDARKKLSRPEVKENYGEINIVNEINLQSIDNDEKLMYLEDSDVILV